MAKRKSVPETAAVLSRPSLADIPAVSSTQLQNQFGGVLDDLRSKGAIVIERHDRPAAVLVSVEEFARLRAHSQPDRQLNMLTAEFDALVARMQTPKANAGLMQAFAASPAELEAASAPLIKRSIASGRLTKRK